MARTPRNDKIDSRNARLEKLKYSRNGTWITISKGRSFGYRKAAKGNKNGSWIARLIDDGIRKESFIGLADDYFDADGDTIFDYAQAIDKARTWYKTALNNGVSKGDSKDHSVKASRRLFTRS